MHWISAALLAFSFGCTPKQEKAPVTGTYGYLTNKPSKNVATTRVNPSGDQPWTNGEMAVIQSDLSPATLYRCNSKTISFFANMPETGIGGPTFAAIETEQGPKIFKPGDKIDPARLRESWFVVWWAGASGWTNWDSPWFLTLQHRPETIRFDTNGLRFTFSGPAGYTALMPMYGYYKPLQAAQESSPFAQLKEKKKRVLTWEWFKALPADPLARARYWASALREFPIRCEESFSVNRGHDSVTIRQSFRWLSWDDDWNTKHLKLAPVSPVLALAYKESFPVQFSKKPFDMEIPTPFGPFHGIEGADSYDVTLPVLRYVHETIGAGSVVSDEVRAPCFAAWQQAHTSGEWESLRNRWPALRDDFLKSAGTDWPAFASTTDVSPLEKTANALGAARVAYRLGDADTYAAACNSFARAITQLCAQQRGLNYLRGQQPWHSMELMGVDAAVSAITANGWQIDKPGPPSNLVRSPDLARLWRDVQSASPERRLEQAGTKAERLIPGGTPTSFLFNDGREFGNPRALLLQAIEPAPTGPRLTWPNWKTPTHAAWNFGQIVSSTNSPARVESQSLNRNTMLHVFWR